MRIHLYALCWNELPMLPYFFRHYDDIIDQFFIYDDNSDDGSVQLLQAHPKVHLSSFNRFGAHGDSFVKSALEFYNQAWKQSRSKADWVIICNIDEHLYHQNLRSYLTYCSQEKISLITCRGYQMIAEQFPQPPIKLCDFHTQGIPWIQMNKPELFDPNKIEEINFIVGRHRANPIGEIKQPSIPEVKLLHYKYLGLDYLVPRLKELGERLGPGDIAHNFGHKYRWSLQEIQADFAAIKTASIDVMRDPIGVAPVTIDGVTISSLKSMRNMRGYLTEIQRRDEPNCPEFGQIYLTHTLPKTIKAWYRHHLQIDQIIVIAGSMRLALYDVRLNSPSYSIIQEIQVTADNPQLIKIPPLIWHGFMPIGNTALSLLHINSEPYNFSAPDEERLPPNTKLIPFKW